jgi:diguanylate cyclase (GGDEF)-like protein
VTAALANWQLDDAEELLADVERDPSPYAAAASRVAPESDAAPEPALGRAWADTLRAELLVRRLRKAGFTLVGEPVDDAGEETALDLHAGVAGLIDGDARPNGSPAADDADPRSESASRAALAIALVRSAKAAFDATEDDLQRAAGLARHARIELLSRRIDAAMDEAVEAASLLDPALPPSALLVDTLGTLAGVLADLELMPLALDYQRRAHETALAAAEQTTPGTTALVAGTATRLGELCAELGEALLDDGSPDTATPRFEEARALAEEARELTSPDSPERKAAQVVHAWALVGLGEHEAAVDPLRGVVAHPATEADRSVLASARLALGRALRRLGDGKAADEHLVATLDLATEQGLPRLRRAALRELCTLHAELDDAGRALPYLQAYLTDELDRVDERRTRWVELFGRRKSLLETERAAGQLRRQAYEDPLTHLPNRRYAEARLDGLLDAGAAPALAVVDVDHFKAINDAIGHPGGDAVLRKIAELLVAGCRDSDEVCRWAGDEFVILLPETTAEQAERAVERIRRKMAAFDWTELGLDEPVTLSVGIASATLGDDRRTLFAAADGVLYDAKRSGRDRVVRLSGVTQTRAGDGPAASPLDALFGPPPVADTAPSAPPVDDQAAVRVADVQPSPLDEIRSAPASPSRHDTTRHDTTRHDTTAGFGRLLVEPPADPPLGSGPDPQLGPLTSAPLAQPASQPVSEPVSVRPAAPLAAPVEPEVIWATGRSTEQVLALVREARAEYPDRPAIVLRASAETLVAIAGEHDAYTTMDAAAGAAAVGPLPESVGRVGVLCASAGDLPVAAEAAFVARVSGATVTRVDEVGGPRLRRLLADPAVLSDSDCLVVVAGLDASTATMIGSMTDVPVVAVPTSTGSTGAFGGLSALMTMLNAASPGVVVSNVDNGYTAGVFATRVARRTAR